MHVPETLWKGLLDLKKQCDQLNDSDIQKWRLIAWHHNQATLATDLEQCEATHDNRNIQVLISREPLALTNYQEVVVFDERLYLYFIKGFDANTQSVLHLYLPLATSQFHHFDQSFIIVHMAQSLDGKVCTLQGNSKWIGNDENLRHAHRIRALVDGVVVGGNTARNDKPSLNVRHVKGDNPARIFLTNTSDGLRDIPQITNMRTFLLCQHDHIASLNTQDLQHANIDTITYGSHQQIGSINDALQQLKKVKVRSMMVEGGPQTIRTFIENKAVDCLQLHIAPMIFGSGYSFVNLNEISEVDQALFLNNIYYSKMGNAMMTTGELLK